MTAYSGNNGIVFAPDRSFVTVYPSERTGECRVPSSKSIAHRMLICAALSEETVKIRLTGKSDDIDATVSCLREFGSRIIEETDGDCTVLTVRPIDRAHMKKEAVLDVRESGSTLRFLLPVACALGLNAIFKMGGRLPERPIKPLTDALEEHGVRIVKSGNELKCEGRLAPGSFAVPGDVSSQFISGLLFALPLLGADSEINVNGRLESEDYVKLTVSALKSAGIGTAFSDNRFSVPGNQRYRLKGDVTVEGDWSGAAFLLCAGAMSEKGVTVCGLRPDSVQGDRKITEVLKRFGAECGSGNGTVTVRKGSLKGTEIDASGIPDLVPAIAVTASVCEGKTRIYGAGRLRFKESDRIKSTADMINSLGGKAEETSDGLMIEGAETLSGGRVDSYKDHRIAMAAALASCRSLGPVTVSDPDCISKSFPGFWDEFGKLGADDNG